MAGAIRRAAGGCLAALAAALAVAPSASGAQYPLDGNGMWIWYVSQSGGNASAIADKARNHNFRTVLIKSSDGGSAWSQFTPQLVARLQDRGLRVCAWQFVYGDRPRAEAQRGAEAVAKGADCLVIDAESAYEGKYRAADRYLRGLRGRIGHSYPLALAGFPYVDYHQRFPFSVFLGRGGATMNAPQVYWRTIGTSVPTALAHTYTWNRPYDRRIFPLGQTYQNPPDDELRAFRRRSAGYNASGVSWWSWQETGAHEWDVIGRRLSGPYPDPPNDFPRLSEGARGDTVLLLQELLRSAGKRVGIDGTFGSGTTRAVRRFQDEHGLDRTGIASNVTWRKLNDFRPVRVNWSQRGNPGFAKALRLKVAPAVELPSTPGRP